MDWSGFEQGLDAYDKVSRSILEILKILSKVTDNISGKTNISDKINKFTDELMNHVANGGHITGFVVNEEDKKAIFDTLEKTKDLKGKDNFSFDCRAIPNINSDGQPTGDYTIIFKDSDYEKANKMCEYMLNNDIPFSFKYKKYDIREALENAFKDIPIGEIEIDKSREDLLSIMKEEFGRNGVEFYINNKEDTKGLIFAAKDESLVKDIISNARKIEFSDKESIYKSYKNINDRTEAKNATKELISSKPKKKTERTNEK